MTKQKHLPQRKPAAVEHNLRQSLLDAVEAAHSGKALEVSEPPKHAPDLLQRAHEAVHNLDNGNFAAAEIRTFLFGGEHPSGDIAPHEFSLVDLLAAICDKSEALLQELNMIRERISENTGQCNAAPLPTRR